MAAIIRKAKEGDEKQIALFATSLFEQHVQYDPERFSSLSKVEGAEGFYRGRFTSPGAAVIVADIDGAVVGFAYIEKDERNYAELLENGAWLHDIFVSEAVRYKGIGKGLLDAAIAAAAELGAEKLLLTVAARNGIAHSAFEKAGFRTTMLEMTLNLNRAKC